MGNQNGNLNGGNMGNNNGNLNGDNDGEDLEIEDRITDNDLKSIEIVDLSTLHNGCN